MALDVEGTISRKISPNDRVYFPTPTQVSTRFSLSMENELADAGRDG